MSDNNILETKDEPKNVGKLVEGVDYYFDEGLMVLTGVFLFKRGYCCGNGCRRCPYPKNENTALQQKNI